MNHTFLRCCAVLLLIGFGLAWFKPAHAQAVSCSASMSDVNFGNVDPQSSRTDTTGTLAYSCTNNDHGPRTIALCFSLLGQETDPRSMADGAGDALQFQLYTDPARTQPWGNMGFGTQVQGFLLKVASGQTSSASATIQARVLGGQTSAVPGAYTDFFLPGYFRFTTHAGGGTPASCLDSGDFGLFNGFRTTAQVTAQCTVSAATLDFGTVGLLAGAVPGTSTISVQCASGTPYDVGLDAGLNGGGNINARRMVLGANSIAYQLYRDPGRTLVWGNTVDTDTVAGTGNGNAQSLAVYGSVPTQPTPPAGTYNDTITVTVTY